MAFPTKHPLRQVTRLTPEEVVALRQDKHDKLAEVFRVLDRMEAAGELKHIPMEDTPDASTET